MYRDIHLREEGLDQEAKFDRLLGQKGNQMYEQNLLFDSFGRIARKLRISLTDRCNMRCMYCMPKGKIQWFNKKELLNFEEITRLVSILGDLGIERVRLTGGEPLLRPRLEKLILSLARINGIKSVNMTTNGLLLSRSKAMLLKNAGLDGVNISLDTFKQDRFKAITGINCLNKVIDAIDIASQVGLKVKINTVVVRGWNDDEIVDFAKFARDTGHIVRFIEFMPLDGSGIWQPNLVFSKEEMIKIITYRINAIMPLSNSYNNNDYNIRSADPAMLYSFVDGKGILGFIPSITEPFCGNCDRIRITSDGRLMTCLFESPGYDLASMLRTGKSEYYIKKHILRSLVNKPEGIIKIIKNNRLKPTLNLMHTIGG